MPINVPKYVRDNAARGIKFYEDGLGGSGLVEATIADARALARGEVSEAKIRKIGPWIARHIVDLDVPANSDPENPDYPGHGAVAMLLWGAGTNKDSAQRTQKWAERETEKLDEAAQNKGRTMNTQIQHRVIELRALAAEGTFEGLACAYNVTDAYGTTFKPGCFTRGGLDTRVYALLWMHDPERPVGTFRAEERADGLYIVGQWDQNTAGQEARAAALSGSAGDLSVGFAWLTDPMNFNANDITIAQLREVSQVTSRFGAVPGSQLTAVRSADELEQERAGWAIEVAAVEQGTPEAEEAEIEAPAVTEDAVAEIAPVEVVDAPVETEDAVAEEAPANSIDEAVAKKAAKKRALAAALIARKRV